METYIALLRGINVGGQKKIKMAELREQLQVLGFTNLKTYIQSGNIVFQSHTAPKAELANSIHQQIKQDYGFEVPTLVLTTTELHQIVAENSFLTRPELDPKSLHVTILASDPDPALVHELEQFDDSPGEFSIMGRRIYLCVPTGYRNTKVDNNFIERKLKVQATTRNWRTCNKLWKMAQEVSG
ncbi:MAG: DUF1697 domain-containing protein [Bacteroidota bacterium]